MQVVESSGKLEMYVVARQGHNKRDSSVLFNDSVCLYIYIYMYIYIYVRTYVAVHRLKNSLRYL